MLLTENEQFGLNFAHICPTKKEIVVFFTCHELKNNLTLAFPPQNRPPPAKHVHVARALYGASTSSKRNNNKQCDRKVQWVVEKL